MLSMLRKCVDVIREEGVAAFISNSKRNIENGIKRKRYYHTTDKAKVTGLKDRYLGKRVFLIGNGPSLNITPLYLLRDEYTIVFNRFTLMLERLNWTPTFYMVTDPVVARDMALEINEIVPIVRYAFFPDIHTDGTIFRKFIKNSHNVIWLEPYFKGFHLTLPRVALGGTVAFSAIQVLMYLGFKEIILLGVDMNYKIHMTVREGTGNTITATLDDDPNHFDPRYYGRNRSYHQPNEDVVTNILRSFDLAQKEAEQRGVTVINAGIDSLVRSFKRVPFHSLFGFERQEIFSLFWECLGINSKDTSIPHVLPEVIEVKEISEWDDSKKLILIQENLGKQILKEKIMQYIPYGPIEGKILLKKRS